MEETKEAEFIVVGLGGHGSAIAAHLAAKGHSVIGLDKFPPCHSKGSSHGRSRVFRTAYYEHPAYVPLLKRALDLWKELNSRDQDKHKDKEALLKMTGALIMGASDSPSIVGTLQATKEHELEHELLTMDQVNKRWPKVFEGMLNSYSAIYEQAAGLLVPENCVSAHLEWASSNGATLMYEDKGQVVSWSDKPSFSVTTASGKTFKASKGGVLSVGAWAGEIYGTRLPKSVPLTLERRVLYWLRPNNAADLKAFSDAKAPIYFCDLQNPSKITGEDTTSISCHNVATNFYGFPIQKGKPENCLKIAW
jgi:sarcosine oxidase